MSSESKSIINNALFGFSTWLLPLVASFIATPIIVSSLGNKDYGIYALVLGFIGYSFNFGIGRSITKYLAQFRADGTPEKATKIISATLTLNLIVGISGALLLIVLADWLVVSVFAIETADRDTSVRAFYLAGMILFMTMLSQVGNSLLQGIHRFDVYSRLFNANSIGIIAGNVVLALLGYGILHLLWWNLIALTLTSIAGLFIAKYLIPEFRLRLDFSKNAWSATVGFSMWIVGYQILGNIMLLFERGWITRKLGPESLTFYVVPLTIGFYIHSFISSVTLMLFPLATELKNDPERLERLYRKAIKISVLLVVFIVLSLAVEGYLFLGLWMGPDFARESTTVLTVLSIAFGLLAILIVPWQMAEGLGHPRYNFFLLLACLFVTLTGMIVTIDLLQNLGIAYSRLAGFGVMFFSIVLSEKWFFGRFNYGYWLKLVLMLAPAVVATALTEYFVLSNLNGSWITLIVGTIAGGIVYVLVLLFLGFLSEDEKLLLKKGLGVS